LNKEVQVENEVSRIRDVSEYELIQDREQVSEGKFINKIL
jgi:hypothetical protein